jgi:hypothetical protein
VYLFYLDESGDPYSWENQDNFVLAGVAVHEGQVRKLTTEIEKVQSRFLPEIRVAVELHAEHIAQGRGRFRKMPIETRVALLDSAYGIIESAVFPNLIGFVSAVHVSAVTGPAQALRDCLENICMSFNSYLIKQFKAGYKDKGLIIMDQSGRETRIREMIAEFANQGTRRGYLGNVIDVPYFADSKHTRMLQLADLLAFAGGRFFNAGDRTYLNRISRSIFRQSGKGKRQGLRHIISRDYICRCIACHDRY